MKCFHKIYFSRFWFCYLHFHTYFQNVQKQGSQRYEGLDVSDLSESTLNAISDSVQQTTQERDNASQQTVTLTTSILSNTEIQSGTAVGLQVSPGKSQAVSTDQDIGNNTNQVEMVVNTAMSDDSVSKLSIFMDV